MLYDVFLVESSGDTLLFVFVCLFAACNRSGGKTNLPIPLRDEESDQLTMTLSWVFFVYSLSHHLPSFLLRACVVCWRPGLLLRQQPLPIVGDSIFNQRRKKSKPQRVRNSGTETENAQHIQSPVSARHPALVVPIHSSST